MLIDRQLQFSNAQALTTTAASTDSIDIGLVRNIGAGASDLFLVMVITTTFAGAGVTMTPSLQSDDNSAFSSPATVATYDVFAALTPANTKRIYKLDPFNDLGNYEQFLRLNYTISTTLTGGAITSFLSLDAQTTRLHAAGFVVQ